MADSGYFPLAYRDGEFVPLDRLTLHCECQALRYALSVFEGIRGYRQDGSKRVVLFALRDHLERFQRSLAAMHMPAIDIDELTTGLEALVARNEATEDVYLRLAASASGLGDLGVNTEISLSATLKPMGRKGFFGAKGMRLSVSSRRKPADDVFPQYAKNISNYSGPRLALLEAKSQGYDGVILRSPTGTLAEAPTANLFLVQDGKLSTPRVEDGILPGITRATLLALARDAALEAQEGPLDVVRAYGADEAFLCGTGLEIASIASFDDVRLPERRPVTELLASKYMHLVRNVERTRTGVGLRAALGTPP